VRRPPQLVRTWIEAGLALILVSSAFVMPGALSRSARAGSPPPPTPVNGSPSPFPTSLVTPTPSLAPPGLTAATAVLEDLDDGQTLFSKAARARRPIASLTKIMTALVVMARADPDEIVAVSGNAASQSGSSLGLLAGERITVRQLLYALLLQSSNDAAVALAEHVGGSVGGFLELMNRTARRLGMTDSFFTSPSGLDDRGYSSARDLAIVTREAYGRPLFERIVKTKFHDVPSPSGPARHIQNRNILLWLYPGAIGVKTGFTTPAGHCLIAAADRDGVRLLVVALGSGGDDAGGVFNDGAALLNYGYSAFRLETLIHAGDPLGPFAVDGASVPAVAAGSIQRLIRLDLIDKVTIEVRMLSGLRLPVGAGENVGRATVSVDGKRAGVVDAVATASVTGAPSSSPPSTPTPSPPASAGSWGQLVDVFRDLLQAVVGPFL
jgi:serine-type D-Ala-D-Ala carboxypeptidase (penicillin-binding protein 5/6)